MELDIEESKPAPRLRLSLGSLMLLIGAVGVVTVFGITWVQRQQAPPTSGAAPDFTLTTFDGGTLRLSELRGQIVVVNFWASWCGPCRDEVSALQAISERYHDRDVRVVGVVFADSESNARGFLNEFGITYPAGLDVEKQIADAYRVNGVPQTFIIDRDGGVAKFFFAQVDEPTLSATLDDLLAKA